MNGRGRRSDQPDGDGVLGRAHRVEMGGPGRRLDNRLPDTPATPRSGRGRAAGVRGEHTEHGGHVHGRHAGSTARVPCSGDQCGGPEPTLELRQRDPVGPGTAPGNEKGRAPGRAARSKRRPPGERKPPWSVSPRILRSGVRCPLAPTPVPATRGIEPAGADQTEGAESETGHMYHIHSRTGARNECPGGIKILLVTTALILAVLLTGCSLHCSSLPRSQAPNLRIKQLRALP